MHSIFVYFIFLFVIKKINQIQLNINTSGNNYLNDMIIFID